MAPTISAIPSDTHGQPPILGDLESKFISLVKSIRSIGGVVNFCVVKATALAIVDCNKMPYLSDFGGPFTGAAILLAERERPLVLQFPEECLKNVSLHFYLTLTS